MVNIVRSTIKLDNLIKTVVTPLSPIFSGLWGKRFAVKWRGTFAELGYDSY